MAGNETFARAVRAKHDEFDRYVVEVCTDCCWNFLGRRELHGKKVG